MKPTRTIFFGTPEIAARLLREAAGWPWLEIVAVITEPAKPAGRGRQLTDSPVKIAAQELDLTVIEPANRAELVAAAQGAELGLLLAYGRILPPEVLRAFPQGIVNLHPSLLPKYRGPAPVFWPILNGDAETGVSIMLLDAGCDTGPLLAQQTTCIAPTDTTERLTDRLIGLGIGLLAESLPQYLNGELSPQPQRGEATLTRKLASTDGQIDWSQPAEQIERQVRACLTWPRARASWHGESLLILEAKIVDGQLEPVTVQPAGRRAMPWVDFCRGQRLHEAAALNELTRLS
jgi:methionyl-tRNA formyltransferase